MTTDKQELPEHYCPNNYVAGMMPGTKEQCKYCTPRPAKAEDNKGKAEAVEAFETAYARFKSGYCDGQKKAEFANGRQILIMDHEADAIRAALTPESEGIAGKVEFQCEVCGALNNERMITALSTLTRPQEIDVEQLKQEVVIETCDREDARHPFVQGIYATIDHLAALGRLK